MTDHEQPQHGGSYRRENDGSLTRIDESTAAAPIATAETPAAEKPARPKKEK